MSTSAASSIEHMVHRFTVAPLLAVVALLGATTAGATTPLPTTREDFRLPGTQPLSLTDPIAVAEHLHGLPRELRAAERRAVPQLADAR